MANSPNPAVQHVFAMHELQWSHAEKAIARRAFNLALSNELEALVREAKGRAAKIEEPFPTSAVVKRIRITSVKVYQPCHLLGITTLDALDVKEQLDELVAGPNAKDALAKLPWLVNELRARYTRLTLNARQMPQRGREMQRLTPFLLSMSRRM